MEIFYEDVMENFNKNIREKLIQLVNEYKIIIIKGLSSAQRHTVYRQIYYPLKFEKIVINENNEENTDIRIYNYKIKQKGVKQNHKNNENEATKDKTEDKTEEKIKQTNDEDEYILEDSEQDNSDDSEYKSESEEDSYMTEEDEQLTKLEDIGSQILEKIVNNEKKINRITNKINLVIILNIIGWVILYTLDPVRVIYINKTECKI
jgi:hypothetical protein